MVCLPTDTFQTICPYSVRIEFNGSVTQGLDDDATFTNKIKQLDGGAQNFIRTMRVMDGATQVWYDDMYNKRIMLQKDFHLGP